MNLANRTQLAGERLQRIQLQNLLADLEELTSKDNGDARAMDMSKAKLQSVISGLTPRLYVGNWSHLFGPGKTETQCRILIDVRDCVVICAQAKAELKYVGSTEAERDDLADSIFNANGVDQNPEEWGFEPLTGIPNWLTHLAWQPEATSMPEGVAQTGFFRSIEAAREAHPEILTGAWRMLMPGDDATFLDEAVTCEQPGAQSAELGRIEPFLMRYEGKSFSGFVLEATRSGDPGSYDEARMSVLNSVKDCVADVLVGLSPEGEPRVLVTTEGDGDGDHSITIYPLRDRENAVKLGAV